MTLPSHAPSARPPEFSLDPDGGHWNFRWHGAGPEVAAWFSGCRVTTHDGAAGSPAPDPPAAAGVARLDQVHGSAVARVSAPGVSPACDAAVTRATGLTLVVRVADCVPLFLVSPGGLGVAHAGWRGTVADIAGRTVAELAALTGDAPGSMTALIGPAIGPCCFEIGPEVAREFAARYVVPAPRRWLGARRAAAVRPHVDLWSANADQLAAAGVPRGAIRWSGLCTRCHQHLFHSYRGSGGAPGRVECGLRRREPAR